MGEAVFFFICRYLFNNFLKKNSFYILLGFFLWGSIYAQDEDIRELKKETFSPTDQIYINGFFNNLSFSPLVDSKMISSLGWGLGFIKDIPLNMQSQYAIGLGLGYGVSNYLSNIFIKYLKNDIYNLGRISNKNFPYESMELNFLDMLLEFRSRNMGQNIGSYFRLHLGFQLSYLMVFNSYFYVDNKIRSDRNIETSISRWHYGPRILIGYGLINIFAYYGLNSFFLKRPN